MKVESPSPELGRQRRHVEFSRRIPDWCNRLSAQDLSPHRLRSEKGPLGSRFNSRNVWSSRERRGNHKFYTHIVFGHSGARNAPKSVGNLWE
jgi:hypothetical protein